MSGGAAPLDAVAALFLSLSLVAFGGVNVVLPEIHRQAVDAQHWLSAREFADLYAITQAAPGPNLLIVSLIGYRAAGLAGAIVATLAMLAPAAVLVYVVAKAWDRFRGAPWRDALQAALAPLTAGLVASSAAVLIRAADTSLTRVAITVVTVAVATFTRVNPLVIFGGAAALGMLGLV